MNKQTVNERYAAQQKMQQKVDRRTNKLPIPNESKTIELIYQQIERGLVQVEQAIRQAGNEEPSLDLTSAEARLNEVIGLVTQVQEEANAGNSLLTGSMMQQLNQLSAYVTQAAQTIQQMQGKLQK